MQRCFTTKRIRSVLAVLLTIVSLGGGLGALTALSLPLAGCAVELPGDTGNEPDDNANGDSAADGTDQDDDNPDDGTQDSDGQDDEGQDDHDADGTDDANPDGQDDDEGDTDSDLGDDTGDPQDDGDGSDGGEDGEGGDEGQDGDGNDGDDADGDDTDMDSGEEDDTDDGADDPNDEEPQVSDAVLTVDPGTSPFGICMAMEGFGPDGLGANWVRVGDNSSDLGNWAVAEPTPGAFVWDPAEGEFIFQWDSYGLIPLSILGNPPTWATNAPDDEDVDTSAYPPLEVMDYFRYCRGIAETFAGRVPYWEIWNEPDIDFFRGPIVTFADVLKAGAAGVRAGDPAAYVLNGGTAGADHVFLDRCYQFGMKDYVDVIALHTYQNGTSFDETRYEEDIQGVREMMATWADNGKRIWLTELGWSTTRDDVSYDDQARLLVQYYATIMARRDLGVERAFWYIARDFTDMITDGDSAADEHGFGLYDDDAQPKPAWCAYQALVDRLGGRVCIGSIDMPEGARAYVFSPEQTDATEGPTVMLITWATGTTNVEAVLPADVVPVKAWDQQGTEIETTAADDEGTSAISVTPEAIYYLLDAAPTASLIPTETGSFELPDPARRSPAWVSVYPQTDCALPYLVRGETNTLTGRFFNGTDAAVSGQINATLVDTTDDSPLLQTTEAINVDADDAAEFTLTFDVPADLTTEARLVVEAQVGVLSVGSLNMEVLVGDGPTISFLGNSYLDRHVYLADPGTSMPATSARSGGTWTYGIPAPEPTPFTGEVQVRLFVGAHLATAWTAEWSADAADWQPLLAAESWPDWQTPTLNAFEGDTLYLRFDGDDMSVNEVRVTFVR